MSHEVVNEKVVRTIDSISEWTGKIGWWLGVVLVLMITYGVVMRYVFVAPLLWVFDVSVVPDNLFPL